jgi:CheY-like chemotaxis protein
LQAKSLVLIIDDDSWIRMAMADLLASEGFALLEATDGGHGLQLAHERSQDLIPLDLILLELALPLDPPVWSNLQTGGAATYSRDSGAHCQRLRLAAPAQEICGKPTA